MTVTLLLASSQLMLPWVSWYWELEEAGGTPALVEICKNHGVEASLSNRRSGPRACAAVGSSNEPQKLQLIVNVVMLYQGFGHCTCSSRKPLRPLCFNQAL